ncbi:MAG: hypothetical protein JKY20_11200 [Alphaproteobacteria bacterium]|nr:hypothetical protein [Alphaproteobacteria bacterium]
MGLLQPYVRHCGGHGKTRLIEQLVASTLKVIEVTNPIQATAAVNAAVAIRTPLMLISAEGAAAYAGPSWFAHLVKDARAQFPGASILATLDCGDHPGLALAALREGIACVRIGGPAFDKVADIAAQLDAQAIQARPALLSLSDIRQEPEFLLAACENWLRG